MLKKFFIQISCRILKEMEVKKQPLIFQMLDFLNLGSKVVGNGYDTTAQYGGTLVSGDIGKLQEDSYELNSFKHREKILQVCLKIQVFKKKKIKKKKNSLV